MTLSLSLAAVAGCANNPVNRGDGGMDGGRADGATVEDGPCGKAGGACCASRICELGLQCGRGDLCCIQPGSSAVCRASADCCQGLACQGTRCCAPKNTACSASSDCCMGLVCGRDGTCKLPGDADPGNPACGAPGMACCDGFSCRDEAVCVEGTCASCGQPGQPCCDGTSACTSPSLSCEVVRDGSETRTRCVDPTDPAHACGEVDQRCCAGASGAPTDCSGALVCRGGMCLRDTDRGFEGAPCGARGTCDPGLVCDRSTDPNGLCRMPPGDCGRDGQMCCDLGGRDRVCTGSYHCQFGECDECRGPSVTCVLGGLVPGQQCCGGSVCRPAPLAPRCCMGPGGRCENSLDCCGLMFCGSDNTCQCNRDGAFCLDTSECCEGLTCQDFQCRAGGQATCDQSGAACSTNAECCAGLACSETRTEPTAPPVRQCCSGGSTSCEEDEDCCGRMRCESGECECVGPNLLCDRDIECCDTGDVDHICVAGSCVPGESCSRELEACDPTEVGSCCGRLWCIGSLTGAAPACCVGQGNRCRTSEECCGRMTCGDNEECQCVPTGSVCETNLDCCQGLSCLETSSGSGRWTCRVYSGP